jgi:hypothetical protein
MTTYEREHAQQDATHFERPGIDAWALQPLVEQRLWDYHDPGLSDEDAEKYLLRGVAVDASAVVPKVWSPRCSSC